MVQLQSCEIEIFSQWGGTPCIPPNVNKSINQPISRGGPQWGSKYLWMRGQYGDSYYVVIDFHVNI